MKFIMLMFIIVISFCDTQINTALPPQNKHKQTHSVEQQKIFTNQIFQYRLTPLTNFTPNNSLCSQKQSHLELRSLFQIKQSNSQGRSSFIYSTKHEVIYMITNTEITAYKYIISPQSHLVQLSKWEFSTKCAKNGAIDQQQNYLYVFSCDQIIMFNIKTILVDMVQIASFKSPFSGRQVLVFQDVFIWESVYQGIRIYGKLLSNNLTLIQQITKYKEYELTISDIAYNRHNAYLYILNNTQSIFLFSRNSNNTFSEYERIILSPSVMNVHLKLWKNQIFITSIYGDNSVVVQLQYYHDKVDLIRYFKGYKNIMHIDVVNEKLIVATESKIDIYPINIDPRQINNLMNGVTNGHVRNLLALSRLNGMHYIFVTLDKIQIVQMALYDPIISCVFEEQGTYQLQVPSECQQLFLKKDLYYDSCEKYKIITLIAIEPHLSRFTVISSIIVTVMIFSAIIMFLINWRKNKMQIIDRLVNEIRKIRLRHKERIEFVEEKKPTARERDWNYQMANQMGTQAYQLGQQRQMQVYHQQEKQ